MTAVQPCRVLVVLLCLVAPAAFAAPSPDEVKARLETVQKEIRALREQVDRSKGEAGGLQEELRAAEEGAARASARLAATSAEIALLRQRLGVLERRRNQEVDAIAAERDRLAATVRAVWRMGREDRLRLLLNQRDPAVIGRVMAWYDRLNAARIERIAAVEYALAALAATEHEINAQIAVLDAAREREAAAMAAVEAQRKERAAVLAALREEIARGQGALAALEGDEKRLESLLHSLTRALSDVPDGAPGAGGPFASHRGKMAWPVSGEVRADYGDARAGGGALTWRGMFIATPFDRPVRAIHPGRVIFADWMRGLGLLVIIDHGRGYMSLYGHLSRMSRSVGEWLQAGDEVGRTGDSGGQAESGLYFEIRYKGKPQDPALWCSGKPSSKG